MKLTPSGKLIFSFSLLAVVPLVLGVFAFHNVDNSERASAEIAKTNRLILALQDLETELKELESAQQMFLLTSDAEHLDRLTSARKKVTRVSASLDGLGVQKLWLEHLRTLIPEKFAQVDHSIALRNNEGLEAAVAYLRQTEHRAQPMEGIRLAVADMLLRETKDLQARTADQYQTFRNIMIVFGTLLAFNIAFISVLYAQTNREESRIRALNQELEQRVSERTKDLLRSNEDLQQFAYVASHDLKEPMRMISSYSSLLQRRYHDQLDSAANTYLDFMINGVKRMNLLIGDLLDYSRTGEVQGHSFETVNTTEVLKEVLENLKISIADCQAIIRYAELPHVEWDPIRLSQVLQNLIANAIKFCDSRSPVVEITAASQRDAVVFSVKDNGIGIDPERVQEIFGIFKRLHGKDYEGTGIGLAMVKKIVERRGGKIWVDSQPGTGSIFSFTVPDLNPNKETFAEQTNASL